MNYKYDVTIALVYYKTPDLLLECLRSIYKYTKNIKFEIIVADNNSGDNGLPRAKKEFPQIQLIKNKQNLFATGGNNQIFKKSSGRHFLVLNPDIKFSNNAIYQMVKFLENNPNIGAVSCVQKNGKEEVHKTCSRFSTPTIEFWENNILGRYMGNKKDLKRYRYSNWNRRTIRIVDVIPDTIMMIRSDVARKLGLYDENIKLFFMENDLCWRIKKAGFSVCHLGNVVVTHYIGQSTKKFSSSGLYAIYQQDRLYYYQKYFGFWWMLFLMLTFQVNYFYYLFEPAIKFLRRKKTTSLS